MIKFSRLKEVTREIAKGAIKLQSHIGRGVAYIE
jgi:hypothetical protein